MILLEIALKRLWQLQFVDAIICRSRGYHRSAQMLQREREVPVQRDGEHWLEKHTAGGILVMFD